MIPVLIVSIFVFIASLAALFFVLSKGEKQTTRGLELIEAEIEIRQALKEQFIALYASMVKLEHIKKIYNQVEELRSSNHQERSKLTLIKAEVDGLDNRLRDLDEIDREIKASALESKEELNILQKREKDLKTKNEDLKKRLAEAFAQIDELLSQSELGHEIQLQIDAIKGELLRTEQKSEELLVQIEEANQAYLSVKLVYDALDIEYAQLYERFSASEELLAQS